MEKQKTISCKSTRFIVLSLTLSFSLLLLSYLFSWAMQFSPFINQQAYFLLNSSSLTLTISPLILPSFTDLPSNNVNNHTFLPNSHVKEHESSPIFVDNKVNLKGFTDLSSNLKVSSMKVANLGGTHFRKGENIFGVAVNSTNFEEKVDVHAQISEEKLEDLGLAGKVDVDVVKREKKLRNLGLVGKVDANAVKGEKKLGNLGIVGKFGEGIGNKKGKDCDVSKGKWVYDEKYPLYTNVSCPFIDEGFNCQGNGRLDKDYMKWRWQPQDCDFPRFNATNMLELTRGKRLVFAGDSINRNQWESLLCLLMEAVKDPRKVYETRGRRITKNRGTYSFRFVDYQCTVEFYVSHFLVRESKARLGKKRKGTLRIDSIDRESARWRGADILVFNTGNWWSHYKTKAGKNYYQEGNEVLPHLDPITAYRKALVTWGAWVDQNINPRKTHVFFRSTAPAHFRGGQWNTGGHCRDARNPLSEMYVENPAKDIIAQEVISAMKTSVTFLNVSGLSSYRIDGHPSKYGRKSERLVEDCSHWCLPGVPDSWNILLYHQILSKQQESLYVS